jgi:beta-lactam-binding protein with PASTA domain
VNLVVSDGLPPENVKLLPDFQGKPADEARRWAEANGVRVTVDTLNAPGFAPGAVIRQTPDPDTDLSAMDMLTLHVAGEGSAPAAVTRTFTYEVPQGGGDRQVRIMLLDESGEQEVFNGLKAPGSKLTLPVAPQGRARVRIFMNGILVEERELQ